MIEQLINNKPGQNFGECFVYTGKISKPFSFQPNWVQKDSIAQNLGKDLNIELSKDGNNSIESLMEEF